MNDMFSDCKKLTQIYLSNFNTSNVINIASIFYRCSVINSLDLSLFNTSKVTSINDMYDQDIKLNNVISMRKISSDCRKLS